jgi:hypothetical protein
LAKTLVADAFMKTQMNERPTVEMRTATNVRPVAAPLRRTSDEKNVPSAPKAMAVTNSMT